MDNESKSPIYSRLCKLTRSKSQVEIILTNGTVIEGTIDAFNWNPLILHVTGFPRSTHSRHLINFQYVVEVRYPREEVS